MKRVEQFPLMESERAMIIYDPFWILIGLIIASMLIDALMYLTNKKQFPVFSIITIVLIIFTAVTSR